MKKQQINQKLQEIYDYIITFIEDNGFSPSIREIGKKFNIKSTATVYSYIEKLKQSGLIDKNPLSKRTLKPNEKVRPKTSIPLIGLIHAGKPVFATENIEGYYPLPPEFNGCEDKFALKVKGDSMINAGIYENDIIIVERQNTAENGEIVVALIDDSATVKRLIKRNNQIVLHPENDIYEDMIFDNVQIIGKVLGLYRKF